MVVTSSRQVCLKWLNLYSEMLDVQCCALGRIRALLAARTTWPSEYEEDIQLVVGEMERVRERLQYWEGEVRATTT